MRYRAKLYNNTWFNKINLPSSPAVLYDNYDPKYEIDVNLTQNAFLSYIKLEGNFNTFCDIDYVEITNESLPLGRAFYTVENIQMLSERVCQLTLLIDPLNTCGGLNYGDGFSKLYPIIMQANRMHISDDEFGKYNLPEDFIPAEPLEIEVSQQMGDTGGGWQNVLNITQICNPDETRSLNLPAQSQTENKEVLLIPITDAVNETKYYLNGRLINGTVGCLALGGDATNKVVNKLRQYGVENSVISSYVLPSEYCSVTYGGARFGVNLATRADGLSKTYTAGGITIQRQCANKKALIGEYNKIVLASNCSGEKVTALLEDVSDGSAISIRVVADPRYDGKPTATFTTYKKYNNSTYFIQAVNGLKWANAPLVYVEKSGSAVDRLNLETNQQFAKDKAETKAIGGIVGGVIQAGVGVGRVAMGDVTGIGSVVGGIGGIVGGVNAMQDYEKERQRELEIFNRNNYYTAPEVNFPVSGSVRDVQGNGFYIIKYRLSDADFLRYDQYLTLFGYNVGSKIVTPQDLYNRQKFNYIRVNEAQFASINIPIFVKNQLEALLKTGVRLWHTKPSAILPDSNPLAGA